MGTRLTYSSSSVKYEELPLQHYELASAIAIMSEQCLVSPAYRCTSGSATAWHAHHARNLQAVHMNHQPFTKVSRAIACIRSRVAR